MRRLLTFLVVATGTMVGSLWWLHEGDSGRVLASVKSGVVHLQQAEVPW